METFRIEILNPRAKRLLKDLADLKLITIKPSVTLKDLLEKFRQNADNVITLDEITEEVEQVRSSRYAKKA